MGKSKFSQHQIIAILKAVHAGRTCQGGPQTGSIRQTLTGHDGVIWQVLFSPDGSKLASGSSDKTVKLWKLQS
jgi:WD40 repeat protein